MKKTYINWKPQTRSEHLLAVMKRVLSETDIAPTVGQLHHLLASERVVEASRGGYKRVQMIAQNARLAGIIDWEALSEAETLSTVPGPYLGKFEVWVSGDAFVPQVTAAIAPWGGRVVVLRGYASVLTVHRYLERVANGGPTPILVIRDGDYAGTDLFDSVVSRIASMSGVPDVYIGDAAIDIEGMVEEVHPEELARIARDFATSVTNDHRPERFAVTSHPDPAVGQAIETSARAAGLLAAIEAAMNATGETTRASSLKSKIRDAIEAHS
jgi:hypothetical protein